MGLPADVTRSGEGLRPAGLSEPETDEHSGGLVEALTIIVGLGNEIVGDDAIGVLASRRLGFILAGRSDVVVHELPWAGLELLDSLRGYRRAILIDSLCSGRYEPGAVVSLTEVDLAGSVRMNSFHDINYPTAMALGRSLGWRMPEDVRILAVEGRRFDRFERDLTPPVAAALERVVEQVIGQLEDWERADTDDDEEVIDASRSASEPPAS